MKKTKVGRKLRINKTEIASLNNEATKDDVVRSAGCSGGDTCGVYKEH